MNFFRRTLPTLDALVFFEAAARHGSFTRAAQELNVTQVAVSKRVRALEDDLGTALFVRRGRTVALTEAGAALADRARAGMAFLEEAIAATRGGARRARRIIQVAANENMNFFWLAPLVRRFQMSGNDAVVSVVTANNVADVVQQETNLAIFYGKAAPDGWTVHPLFDELIAPVAAPAYRDALLRDGDADAILLDYRKEAPEWVNWQTLDLPEAKRWGLPGPRRECSSYIQSISLALEGRGIGLGVIPMLTTEIAENRLVPLRPQVWTGHSYFLCTPAGRRPSPETENLIAYLLRPSDNRASDKP